MKFITGDVYAETLKVTPVAPCGNIKNADTYYEALKSFGHPEAAEAVQTMLDTPTKTAVRFAGDWRDDANKAYEERMNNFLDGKGDDSILDDLAKSVNDMIDMY